MSHYDLIIQKLTEQVGTLSKECAIYYSLYIQEANKNKELEKKAEDSATKSE